MDLVSPNYSPYCTNGTENEIYIQNVHYTEEKKKKY